MENLTAKIQENLRDHPCVVRVEARNGWPGTHLVVFLSHEVHVEILREKILDYLFETHGGQAVTGISFRADGLQVE